MKTQIKTPKAPNPSTVNLEAPKKRKYRKRKSKMHNVVTSSSNYSVQLPQDIDYENRKEFRAAMDKDDNPVKIIANHHRAQAIINDAISIKQKYYLPIILGCCSLVLILMFGLVHYLNN